MNIGAHRFDAFATNETSALAYYGHDFGGMYGVPPEADQRPSHYVDADTPRFPEVTVLPKLEGEPRQSSSGNSAFDPISHIPIFHRRLCSCIWDR